jgi:hypothetical protein
MCHKAHVGKACDDELMWVRHVTTSSCACACVRMTRCRDRCGGDVPIQGFIISFMKLACRQVSRCRYTVCAYSRCRYTVCAYTLGRVCAYTLGVERPTPLCVPIHSEESARLHCVCLYTRRRAPDCTVCASKLGGERPTPLLRVRPTRLLGDMTPR